MRILDLFSGIGGFSLGLHRASETFQTVAFCEMDPFCTQILNKHWPDVPVYPDIRELTYERLKADGVVADPGCEQSSGWTNQKESGERAARVKSASCGDSQSQLTGKINGKEIGTIDIVCGGFPCQPFSQAGKRRGKDDDRDLWPEMFRIIQECQPTWVVGENVAGFVNMELGRTVSNLESEGYEVRTFVLGACAVQAPHQRQRCWIIGRKDDAHSNGQGEPNGSKHEEWLQRDVADSESNGGGRNSGKLPISKEQPERKKSGEKFNSGGQDVADSEIIGSGKSRESNQEKGDRESIPTQSDMCSADVADSESNGTQGSGAIGEQESPVSTRQKISGCNGTGSGGSHRSTQRGMGDLADGLSARLLDIGSIWHIEPDIPRVTTGEKDRTKKLKALGNSVVPQIPEIIGRLIMEVEREI